MVGRPQLRAEDHRAPRGLHAIGGPRLGHRRGAGLRALAGGRRRGRARRDRRLQRGGLPGHARAARLARGAPPGRHGLVGALRGDAPEGGGLGRALAARRELRAELVDGQEPGSPRWLAGELLEYHRREARPQWWRWFHLQAMDAEALIEDGEAIGGLEPTGAPPVPVKRSLALRAALPAAGAQARAREGAPTMPRRDRAVSVTALDTVAGTWSRSAGGGPCRRAAAHGPHPRPPHPDDDPGGRARPPGRVGARWDGPLPRPRGDPRPGAAPRARRPGRRAGCRPWRSTEQLRLARDLDRSHLVVQGPPGTGKTWLGGRIVADLVAQGHRVGLMAVSHKAINNLLGEVLAAADERGVGLADGAEGVATRTTATTPATPGSTTSATTTTAGGGDHQVVAGHRVALRSRGVGRRPRLPGRRRGRAALARRRPGGRHRGAQPDPPRRPAAAPAGVAGDPPAGHVRVRARAPARLSTATVPADRGIFLAVTRRLHPEVCRFISGEIYEGRLVPHPDCSRRTTGAGRRHPLPARGPLRPQLTLAGGGRGRARPRSSGCATLGTGPGEIMVVAPYNAQVRELAAGPPRGRPGGDRRQVPGSGGPGGALLDGDLERGGPAARRRASCSAATA